MEHNFMAPTPLANVIGMPTIWLDRFLSKINKNGPGECWIWTAYLNQAGYGQFKFGGQGAVPWKSHRLCYSLCFGEIPKGLDLHHKCNNPACVNPEHLELITKREHVIERSLTSPSAICARKTHCIRGHEFNEENTIHTANGKRVCRICDSVWRAAKYRATHPKPELKTHCIKGHPLSGDNLYVYKTKTGIGRGCRICRAEINTNYQRQNRSLVKAKERVRNKIKEGKTDFTELERWAASKFKNPPLSL